MSEQYVKEYIMNNQILTTCVSERYVKKYYY